MSNVTINEFPTGSISDNSLGIIGDLSTGALSQTNYHAMKDYFTAGITGSENVNTGSLATTSSLNAFTASYYQDSASFNVRISSITGSTFNTGSLVQSSSFNLFTASYQTDSASFNLHIANVSASQSNYVTTGSFNSYTASAAIQIANVYASESNYTSTASFNLHTASVGNTFGQYLSTSSYQIDSASFNNHISNTFGSQSNYESTSSFNAFSSSLVPQLANIFASHSNYTPTASFNPFTSSLNAFTTSISSQILNIFASESNYTPTASFFSLSSSYIASSASYTIDSSSFLSKIGNVFASESNYLPTSSFIPFSSSVSGQLVNLTISGSTYLNSGSNNVFSASLTYKLNSIQKYPSIIGQIFTANTFANLASFDTASGDPAVAFSASGSVINSRALSSGPMWQFNGDVLAYNQYTNDENSYFETENKITVQGDGLGFGVVYGPGGGITGYLTSIYAVVSWTASMSNPQLTFWQGQTVLLSSSIAVPVSFSIADNIRLRMTKNKGTFSAICTHVPSGISASLSVSQSYSYPNNFPLMPTFKFGLAKFGTSVVNTTKVTLFSNSYTNGKVIFVGDSKTSGLNAGNTSSRYEEIVGSNPSFEPYNIYASSGDRTIDCLHNIPYITTYVKPQYVILNIGRNDLSDSGSVFGVGNQANYNSIVNSLQNAGTTVYHLLPIPELAVTNQSSLYNFITGSYGLANCIDPSVGYTASTMTSGDNIHPNTLGHSVIANNILSSSLFQVNPLTITNAGIGIGTVPSSSFDITGSTANAASLTIRSGSVPLRPHDGDIWYASGSLNMNISGSISVVVTAASASAPSNTITPILWVAVNYNGTIYKLPLYS